MKLIILISLLINTLQAYDQIRSSATIISTTDNGKECMTDCVPYNDYHFCYLGWGQTNWDRCKVQRSDRQVQYYTSMVKGNKPLCTSKCGYYDESYQWCFTGDGGLWDKCSTNDQNCLDCSKYTDGYQCKTSDGELKYCAPDPIHYDEFDKSKFLLKRNVGKYTALGYRSCNNRVTRQFNEDDVRNMGIYNIANAFALLYNVTYLTSGPISSVVTLTVPPPYPEMLNTRLPLVIRARLRRNVLNSVREPIPSYIEHQMVLMNRHPSDERGHLLAASLGGPMHDYNFAPQTPIVNRNYGGDSYWYHIEQNIRDRLRNNNVDYIDWTLIVIYDDLQVTRRPIGFGLRFIVYDNQNNQINDTGDMYFSNDPEGGCAI